MVESNFPVDRISVSTNVLWNCLKRVAMAKGLSAVEKTQLFSATANRVYKLN
jgi:predicted TIM-barrel fold metal-dependent hydrolase